MGVRLIRQEPEPDGGLAGVSIQERDELRVVAALAGVRRTVTGQVCASVRV